MATSDRKPYLTATVLDQDLLDEMQDNLENRLEMVVEIQTPTGTIYASDRNKYVGGIFYEALTNFPVIQRTVGEWLSGELEFSSLEIRLSNVDGRFNNFLPSGSDFGGWIGKAVLIKIGLREAAGTYTTIFSGEVTDIGGFKRDQSSIVLITRDKFDKLNVKYPLTVLSDTTYPDIEPDKIGLGVPVIYGDWTTELREFDNPAEQKASVPVFAVNGLAPTVQDGTAAVEFVVASHDLVSFDATKVYLHRANKFWLFDTGDITVGAGNKSFTLEQELSGGTTSIDGQPYRYESGDNIFVRVKGKDLGAYSDNVIWIARDLLLTYGGLTAGELGSNWTTYRDKATPAQSNIAGIKFRIWRQEAESVMNEVLSLLEQVRLEAFVDRSLKVTINSLHFEDLVLPSGYTVKNWDVERNTFAPESDDRNQWNRAAADFDYDPSVNENRRSTTIHKNQAAITQAGKAVSKRVVFPNMYKLDQVKLQLIEILRMATGYPEMISATLTPRAVLLEPGGMILVDVKIGSTIFDNVPCMVRNMGYDPSGRIHILLWSFQMTPYPAYIPGYPGTVGGYNATITEET